MTDTGYAAAPPSGASDYGFTCVDGVIYGSFNSAGTTQYMVSYDTSTSTFVNGGTLSSTGSLGHPFKDENGDVWFYYGGSPRSFKRMNSGLTAVAATSSWSGPVGTGVYLDGGVYGGLSSDILLYRRNSFAVDFWVNSAANHFTNFASPLAALTSTAVSYSFTSFSGATSSQGSRFCRASTKLMGFVYAYYSTGPTYKFAAILLEQATASASSSFNGGSELVLDSGDYAGSTGYLGRFYTTVACSSTDNRAAFAYKNSGGQLTIHMVNTN
jgi:hypothetical protein